MSNTNDTIPSAIAGLARVASGRVDVVVSPPLARLHISSFLPRLSAVLSSKIYTLKEYFLSFTARTLFYSTTFLNHLCFSYSKFILYINYYSYFIIFSTTNFFSHSHINYHPI
jgi:hypothetical protein